MRLHLARKSTIADDVVCLDLVDKDGTALPEFSAGAHVDIHLANGMTRQYSIVNSPAQRTFYRVAVYKDPKSRGGSRYVHEALVEGQLVDVGVPRNTFPLRGGDAPVVLIGGGIGITPLYSMAHVLAAAGRAFQLFYYGRSRSRMAFLDDLLALGDGVAQVHIHADDESGPPDFSRQVVPKVSREETAYLCGPVPFVERLRAELGAVLPPDRIHVELFGSGGAPPGAEFTVHAARSGVKVVVSQGQSIAEALRASGVAVTLGCGAGVCGTCVTSVLAGKPVHLDACLTAEERAGNGRIAICCSRASTSELVLDI